MLKKHKKVRYEDPVPFSIEIALEKIESLLQAEYVISKRAIGLLLLQDDGEIIELVKQKDPQVFDGIVNIIDEVKTHYSQPLDYIIAIRRQHEVSEIVGRVVKATERKKVSFKERLSALTMHPVAGLPILLIVLYFGLYKFVGEFGAGTLVDYLESTIFEGHINPFLTNFINGIIPWPIVRDLFVGEYGLLTLGLRYSVAIILPIVAMFFIVFSIIEDTGYLPRLAMLIDRIFKRIGLSGRAVIPMVLGFGCATMATMVTRTLPTKRERFIATMLLALAVPCSAQLGVILALFEGNLPALIVWAIVICMVFLFVGFLSSKLLPGEGPSFYMEVPPLRLPKISNIIIKTYTRVAWYFKEILPMFLLASLLIWLGQVTKLFGLIIDVLKMPVAWIGLPSEAATIFLFGFFRRDYGAAGLYDLNKTGLLTGVQLVVASVALTLFLPCIAQLLMNMKERGVKTGIGISLFVLFFSFMVAFLVNKLLIFSGVVL